jgi:hypothetical protein
VDKRYIRAIPSLFTGSVLRSLAEAGRSPVFESVCQRIGVAGTAGRGATLGDTFEALYEVLKREYRCEYLFKNAIASKLLLGRHSLSTATLVTEWRVAECKADIAIINGTSTVYEIKTSLDNLDRLESQLAAYRQVFDRIYVVTEEALSAKVASEVAADVGIMALTPRYTLREMRPSQSNLHRVKPGVIFDSLRVAEYSEILQTELGFVPEVPNGRRYHECKRLFEQLAPEVAHAGMVRVLRGRTARRGFAPFVERLPPSLKAAGMGGYLPANLQARLCALLDATYEPATSLS